MGEKEDVKEEEESSEETQDSSTEQSTEESGEEKTVEQYQEQINNLNEALRQERRGKKTESERAQNLKKQLDEMNQKLESLADKDNQEEQLEDDDLITVGQARKMQNQTFNKMAGDVFNISEGLARMKHKDYDDIVASVKEKAEKDKSLASFIAGGPEGIAGAPERMYQYGLTLQSDKREQEIAEKAKAEQAQNLTQKVEGPQTSKVQGKKSTKKKKKPTFEEMLQKKKYREVDTDSWIEGE